MHDPWDDEFSDALAAARDLAIWLSLDRSKRFYPFLGIDSRAGDAVREAVRWYLLAYDGFDLRPGDDSIVDRFRVTLDRIAEIDDVTSNSVAEIWCRMADRKYVLAMDRWSTVLHEISAVDAISMVRLRSDGWMVVFDRCDAATAYDAGCDMVWAREVNAIANPDDGLPDLLDRLDVERAWASLKTHAPRIELDRIQQLVEGRFRGKSLPMPRAPIPVVA